MASRSTDPRRFQPPTAGFALAAAALLGAGGAHAAPISACQVITESGSYELAQDVTAPDEEICFSIRASDVTLDGQGHTITVHGADAAEVAHFSDPAPTNVVMRNFTSNGAVSVYGDGVSQVTFERLTVEGIYNGAGDDVVIQDNIVGTLGVTSTNNDTEGWFGYRPMILRNRIEGGSVDVKILLEIVGGRDHPCPQIDAVVQDNVLVSTRDDPPPEATAVVRVRCATHTQFTGNHIVSYGTTIGLYLRDESDDGLYENNVFATNSQETIRIASGNEDKTLPARNVFRNNVFRSEAGATTFLQGIGADNLFEHNCFWSQTAGLLNMSAGNTFDHNTFYVSGSGEVVTTLTYRDDFTDHWTNNVFSYAGNDVYGFDGFAFNRYAGDYNLFHNRSGAVAFGGYAASLADWQAASAGAGYASDANSAQADPLFSADQHGDLCLSAGSPGLAAAADGSDLGAATCDCSMTGDAGAGGSGGAGATGGTGTGAGATGASADEAGGDGGCGCRVARPFEPGSWPAGTALTAMVLWGARRRRVPAASQRAPAHGFWARLAP